MNKVITIGREFGSGGRELGKFIAESMGIAYYDKEIIREISKKTKLAEEYVKQIVENRVKISLFITSGHSFYPIFDPVMEYSNNVYIEQTNTLIEMAKKSNCVIIGRCADHILSDYKPLKVFVYSDMESKIERCKLNSPRGENLSDKELKHQIMEIDKNRSKYYQFITGKKWGDKRNYDLCFNTGKFTIPEIAKIIVDIVS